jgi:hypothetical protein
MSIESDPGFLGPDFEKIALEFLELRGLLLDQAFGLI